MIPKLLFFLFLLPATAFAAESRRWIGPDYFPMPLHDWALEEGSITARPASFGGRWGNDVSRLYHATKTIGDTGSFTTRFRICNQTDAEKPSGIAGIWLGLKSKTPSPRNAWIHPPEERFFVGINEDGYLVAGDETTEHPLKVTNTNDITIKGTLRGDKDVLEVTTRGVKPDPGRLKLELPPGTLTGAICLVGQNKTAVWSFGTWELEGDAVVTDDAHAIGPILWTQYTLQDNGTLKLQAQMVPLEESDEQSAILEIQVDGDWQGIDEADLEPLSSTFLFTGHEFHSGQAVPYRVRYDCEGVVHEWTGTIRGNPKDDNEFTLAVSNCDHGELFPQDTMVGNVTFQDPDMLFFAGDQIYENMDSVRIVRAPLEGARLSYLSKWYQFGLTWRHLLKDRPSVIIPDDHDVFMGNVWGDHGRGYSMEPAWVNMIQRTQTGSLPDPADPAPVDRGIEVYFTALDYAGMSFAIIEDRKFKSSPDIAADVRKQKPRPAPSAFDIPGATLLGDRQIAFLESWTDRTKNLPIRWFLSQTMFSKANTNTGSTLKRSFVDLDNNGWPQSARNRALRVLGRDTIMVHGDQHLGVLARLGIDEHDDGPLAFMVTGASVGFPRAWWPEQEPEGGLINGPYTGKFIDDLGHKLTIHGVTNPRPLPDGVSDARERPDYQDKGVFAIQNAKGSGHGLIIVDKKKQTATFEAYGLDFDAKNPGSADQFEGFPITLELR